jgi:hypothetical protein
MTSGQAKPSAAKTDGFLNLAQEMAKAKSTDEGIHFLQGDSFVSRTMLFQRNFPKLTALEGEGLNLQKFLLRVDWINNKKSLKTSGENLNLGICCTIVSQNAR